MTKFTLFCVDEFSGIHFFTTYKISGIDEFAVFFGSKSKKKTENGKNLLSFCIQPQREENWDHLSKQVLEKLLVYSDFFVHILHRSAATPELLAGLKFYLNSIVVASILPW